MSQYVDVTSRFHTGFQIARPALMRTVSHLVVTHELTFELLACLLHTDRARRTAASRPEQNLHLTVGPKSYRRSLAAFVDFVNIL